MKVEWKQRTFGEAAHIARNSNPAIAWCGYGVRYRVTAEGLHRATLCGRCMARFGDDAMARQDGPKLTPGGYALLINRDPARSPISFFRRDARPAGLLPNARPLLLGDATPYR